MQKVIAYMSKSPLLILFLIAMDFVFIFQSIVFKPIIFIISTLSRGKFKQEKLNFIDSFEDHMFGLVFGMKNPEIAGFRRLRTITQMIFETLP